MARGVGLTRRHRSCDKHPPRHGRKSRTLSEARADAKADPANSQPRRDSSLVQRFRGAIFDLSLFLVLFLGIGVNERRLASLAGRSEVKIRVIKAEVG